MPNKGEPSAECNCAQSDENRDSNTNTIAHGKSNCYWGLASSFIPRVTDKWPGPKSGVTKDYTMFCFAASFIPAGGDESEMFVLYAHGWQPPTSNRIRNKNWACMHPSGLVGSIVKASRICKGGNVIYFLFFSHFLIIWSLCPFLIRLWSCWRKDR